MLKFGFFIPQGTFYPDLPDLSYDKRLDTIFDVARSGEGLGFHAGWMWDFAFANLRGLEGADGKTPSGSEFECWTTLAAIAARSTSIRLGSMVTNVNYRHPALLAKIVSTVDNISRGRLEVGLGSGWSKQYEEFGLQPRSANDRVGILNEVAAALVGLLSREQFSFSGKHFRFKNATCLPKPVQRPHPPITIGAKKESAFETVARYANKLNAFCTPQEYGERLSELRTACDKVGRNFSSIQKTLTADLIIGKDKKQVERKIARLRKLDNLREYYDGFTRRRITGDAEQCLAKIQEFQKLGVTEFALYFPDAYEIEPLEIFATSVIPRLE